MSALKEMLNRGRKNGASDRLRRLLACHLAENHLNPGTEDSLLIHVLPTDDGVTVPDQVITASAKGFFDNIFSMVTTEPMPDREMVVGITTGQILSLFRAETGEAVFLGGRLWQMDVELNDIVEGDEYTRFAAWI